jgi:hypothetical protein
MMEKGSSEPWQDVLNELTNGRVDKLDAGPMLEYFAPLTEWLLAQNITQSDWKCDKYIDRKHNTVRSYGSFTKVNRNNLKQVEEAAAATSAASASTASSLLCFSILFIFRLNRHL